MPTLMMMDPSCINSASGQAYLKILMTNMAAGTVTGRQGATIQEIERMTGATLKLSKQGANYPGTQERIGLISGEYMAVDNAMRRILQIIAEVALSGNDPAAAVPHNQGGAGRIVARLVLPNSAVTGMMGAGGANINSMVQRTGASLQFSEKGACQVQNQRILTVSGGLEEVTTACAEIMQAIQGDSHLEGIMVHDQAGPNFGAVSGFAPAGRVGHAGHAAPAAPQSSSALAANVEICFDISDMMAGTIVGRGGEFLRYVTQHTNVSVKVSKQNEQKVGLAQGMRRVVITGALGTVHAAHTMLVAKMFENPAPGESGPLGRRVG